VCGGRQKPEFPSKKEIILKFVAGSQGVEEKPTEIRIRAATRTFSNVGWYGDRSPKQLIS
jgi:hypothetical protein